MLASVTLKDKIPERESQCVIQTLEIASSSVQCFIMAPVNVYTLLGDSNIQRNMNSTNCRDRPLMSDAQVIPCGRLEVVAEALRQIRSASNVVILSCVTNCLTGSTDDVSSISIRVEPILKEFQSIVESFACSPGNEERLILVAPPMYRAFPIWYCDGVSEVLQKFSSMMCSKPSGPTNIHLLPSFPTPSCENDGIHLTPYSGLEFILHLFDSSTNLIQTLSSRPEEVVIRNVESSRVLEDRMMVLEQDHRRLNKVVEEKYAEDAELADFQENIRYEDHFVILGLPHIPKCDTRVWQEKAKRSVGQFVHRLIGRKVKIVFVKNITGKSKDALARFQVQVESVAVSREIRDKFGTFFPGGKDSRPPPFENISVRNRLTHETRVRLNIMRVLAQHWHASNPGSKFQCIGYDSRPTIRLIPSEKATDRRVLTMNFIEAVRTLPARFSSTELDAILFDVKPKWVGKMRSLFVVLSDDMVKHKTRGKNFVEKSKSKDNGSRDRGSRDKGPNKESIKPSSKQASKDQEQNEEIEVDVDVESETELSETEPSSHSTSRGSVKRGPEPVPSKSSKHAKK